MLMFDFMRMRKENEKTIMTQEEFIMETIKNFDKSEARVKMLEGENYYNNGNAINDRVIYRYEDERPVVYELISTIRASSESTSIHISTKP